MKFTIVLMLLLSITCFSQDHKLDPLIKQAYAVHKQYKKNSNDVSAEQLLSLLKQIQGKKSEKLCIHRQAELFHVLSLVEWDYAVKTDSKMKYGKSSFENMKKALELDPSNLVIVQSYAQSIIGMGKSSWVKKKTIQATLGISISKELTSVKSYLHAASLNQDQKSVGLMKQIDKLL